MYARTGTLNVTVCAPLVNPTPEDTYPTVAGNRCPPSRPPNTSRRGVPYASAPTFTDKPNADDTSVLTPAFASHVSGADQETVEPGERRTSVVLFGTNMYAPAPYK